LAVQGDSPQPGRSNYLDFELEIGVGAGREYPVAVLDSPAGEARATMWFPFDQVVLDNHLLTLENALLRSGGEPRRALSSQERAVQDFGRGLFEALFSPEVRSRYDVSQREAAQQGRGLRLKLRIQAPDLAALPWEYLFHPGQAEYVSLSSWTPIVRYLEAPQRIQPLAVTPPLRILGMIASPNDLLELDVEREKKRIEEAVGALRERGVVDLTWLPGQSWRDLQRAMRLGPWHIFHFIGHGGFDTLRGEGLIILADQEGNAARFDASRLGRLLADHASLRFAFLNSCQGAQSDRRDIFSSTAAVLVRKGIPAVLAMQYEITDRAAIEFARTFYEALGDGMPVDGAVAEARKAIFFAVSNTVEWGTPVLYMRSPDGVLFEMAGTPALEPSPGLARWAADRGESGGDRLERLYLAGLRAYRNQEWKEVRRCFQEVVEANPADRHAAAMLAEAEQWAELSALYEQAQAACDEREWAGALSTLEDLVARAPDFRDAAALLDTARRQHRLQELYARAQGFHQEGQWQGVLEVFVQIAAIEPDYADPEGLLPAAQQAIARRQQEAERQRQAQIAALYRQARELAADSRWRQALQTMDEIRALAPHFADPERIAARAQDELAWEEAGIPWQGAALYAEALQSFRLGEYQTALDKLRQVQALDPGFTDPEGIGGKAEAGLARERENERRRRDEIAALYKEAQRLARAQQWQQVLAQLQKITALDPNFSDPEGLLPAARQRLAEQERRSQEVPELYRRAVEAMDAGKWEEAHGLLNQVQNRQPGYRQTEQHLARVWAIRTGKQAPPKASSPTTRMAVPESSSGEVRRFGGVEMVYVPAGKFWMGSGEDDREADSFERPAHEVFVEGFWIDRTPVTNEEYRRFVEATGHQKPGHWTGTGARPNIEAHPVVHVSWHDAQAYCRWRSEQAGAAIRLPTEAEWEKAARGTDGRRYPWGDTFHKKHCNSARVIGSFDTTPVGRYSPGGDSPYGLVDMAGNVWEWTSSLPWAYPYDGRDGRENLAAGEVARVFRGGSWLNTRKTVRTATRNGAEPSKDWNNVGFRCAASGPGLGFSDFFESIFDSLGTRR
jgi:formylglycine-generating enzyme required for sulfatase activity